MAWIELATISFLLFSVVNPALSSTTDYNNNTTTITCPPWFIFDKATKECQCGSDLGKIIVCDNKYKKVYITACFCMTYDDIQGTVAGACTTNCFSKSLQKSFRTYYDIPSNLSELNQLMCGDHWNRGGNLCGRCKDGYHPQIYSYDMRCVECEDDKYNWILFLLAAFVPLTFFFVLVVSCGISASSPQLEAFVVYSQAIASPANVRIFLEANLIKYSPSTTLFCQLIFTLYGIWNLDFFRTLLPPICLQVTTLQALALDYLIAVYPLGLIGVTYTLIDLYDRKVCVLVWLLKPFRKCLKGDFNAKPAFINAFVTFLVLSYVKLLSVSFDLLVYVNVYNPSGENVGAYLFYDASIKYFGHEHLPYAILAFFVVIVFIIFPLMFGLLYSLKCLNRCTGRWPALHICFDSLQGYYKDGTNGTRNCRWFSSVYLIARISLILVYGINKESFYPLASILLLLLIALIFTVRPFKPQFGVYNGIHALLVLNLAMWFMTVVFVQHNTRLTDVAYILLAIVTVLPLFYITGLVFKWIYSKRFIQKYFISKLCCFRRKRADNVLESDSADSIPYRMEYEQTGDREALRSGAVGCGSSKYGTFG